MKELILQDYWEELEQLSNAVIGGYVAHYGHMPPDTQELLAGLEDCRLTRRKVLLGLVDEAAQLMAEETQRHAEEAGQG